jgi:hypothetical protein
MILPPITEQFAINGVRYDRGRLPFQAYVEEAEDESVVTHNILITTSKSRGKVLNQVPGFHGTDGHDNNSLRLHEALDDLMAAARAQHLRKRQRSESPRRSISRDSTATAKKRHCQHSNIDLLPMNDYASPNAWLEWESVQRSKTKPDESNIQENLRLVECAKLFLVDSPVEAAMTVIKSDTRFFLGKWRG